MTNSQINRKYLHEINELLEQSSHGKVRVGNILYFSTRAIDANMEIRDKSPKYYRRWVSVIFILFR